MVLTVEMGLGGREVLFCQKILKIYKSAESAFPAIFDCQLNIRSVTCLVL